MILRKCKYDPAIYGQLRADYLNRLSGSYDHKKSNENYEKNRQDFIKDVKDGKLRKTKKSLVEKGFF